jgi:hypothetical protein
MVPSSRGKRWTVPDNPQDALQGDTIPIQSLSASRVALYDASNNFTSLNTPASAVLDVCSSSKSKVDKEAAETSDIAAFFQAPPPPITAHGNDFSSLHAFHRSGSNVLVGDSPAKHILLSIRSEIRKEESVLAATRKYISPRLRWKCH